MQSVEHDALTALRKARRKNRLQELDWFEAAYRVYLVAFCFGGLFLWASSYIDDTKISSAAVVDMYRHGPAALGMVAVVALAAGLRSGSRGGPLAIEAADVTHVLLAPVGRRHALLRPAVQRARSAAFSGLIAGAVAGQLAGRRLPGSDASWVLSGAAFGATVAALFVGAAFCAHALRVPRWLSTGLGALLIATQVAAIVRHWPGPGNLAGSLALWGNRQRAIDLVAPLAAAALVAIGLVLLGRTSLDALARRSGLVAQLRFAVTMQDLRTVMLLRRQLSQENTRSRPWLRLKRSSSAAVMWRRGWHSVLRFPLSRLARMALFAAGAALSLLAAFEGTTALIVLGAVLLFLLGMEALEPMSQEIDQPDRLAAQPHDRGAILARQMLVPAIFLVPFAAIGLASIAIVRPERGVIGVAAILALPVVWMGMAGAAVSIVRDAPDLGTKMTEQMLPPEMSGLTTIMRALIPVIVAMVGAAGVLIVRATHTSATTSVSEMASAIRVSVGLLLLAGFTAVWVRRRDLWSAKYRSFLDEGRRTTADQRAQRSPGKAT